jgi:hypothetical protein
MFQILVNGILRSYRDEEAMAIDAGRVLKDRDKASEITLINDDTRQWGDYPRPLERAWPLAGPRRRTPKNTTGKYPGTEFSTPQSFPLMWRDFHAGVRRKC